MAPKPVRDSPVSPVRAASNRAAASGLRRLQRTAGGGPFSGSLVAGRSSVVRARASASSHTCALRRWRDPPNTGSAVNFSALSGSLVAALMIAASGRIRPGAMSRR